MNHVNLIGKMSSNPKVVQLGNGRKVAKFTLSTQETYLDSEGNQKSKKEWHRLFAWGKWVQVLENLGSSGLGVAVEGKLTTRFYQDKRGERKFISEVEVNDLVFLS